MAGRKRKWTAAGAIVPVVAFAFALAGCVQSAFEPPARAGPPGLVQVQGRQALWIANLQEEERSRYVGGGRHGFGRVRSEYYTHLRLQAHDPATADRLWLKTLKIVRDDAGGHGALIRILGQQDDVVWVWLHDELVALSAEDASPVADRARLEQANPGLAGLFPLELKYYTWTGEIVVTLADARHMRITLPDLRMVPYEIADDERFRNANYMTGTWNGGFRTKDFGVRHGIFDGRWIGLLGEKEAKDGENDQWGDHFADSVEIDDEGATARRTFRVARTGRTREFSEGSHERIVALDPVPGTDAWLQGAMLKASPVPGEPAYVQRGRHWKPAVRPPLRLSEPDGVLVLHRTRLDAQGKLALARLDGGFREVWTTTLPFEELGNRWELPGRLLLFGDWDDAPPGMSDQREGLVSLDLRTGEWKGWLVEDDKPFGPVAAP